jgi:hypothetical protein
MAAPEVTAVAIAFLPCSEADSGVVTWHACDQANGAALRRLAARVDSLTDDELQRMATAYRPLPATQHYAAWIDEIRHDAEHCPLGHPIELAYAIGAGLRGFAREAILDTALALAVPPRDDELLAEALRPWRTAVPDEPLADARSHKSATTS